MENSLFVYVVRVGHGAGMLRTGQYKEALPNCGEIMISSKQFQSYEECEKNLNNLMVALTRFEAKSSDKNFVIVSKVNPVLDQSGREHRDAASWEKNTIMRAYIADSDELKKSTLKYHVMGQISANREATAFKAEILNPSDAG